jgi:acetyl-CoA carboxylase biotin carboxylase subunit
MFHRILIANRGEIAVRVIRTVREMGIAAVAVYSSADARAPHVSAADDAIPIGGAAPAESYLSIERILEAARAAGADAIHPGYGFLAENAGFAAACAGAGLTFIGPSPEAMTLMGSKIGARRVARDAGVPVVPGEVPADQSDAAIAAAVRRVGFPALIKAAEGGGGIGMEAVSGESGLAEAVGRARREALAAFGDATVYAERLIERPRHIEVQVLADRHGQVVHLFERECSVQRRHQKVVEETPSPAVTPRLRERLGEAAVRLARAAGYENAGTVEFLLEGRGDDASFYFLEMNTRLQVEHPITEAVTGVDLVRAQIGIAAGERLPWTQAALAQRGHAIEVRVYAEDPLREFLPQAGRILLYREPVLPGVRIDSGVHEGSEVPIQYDPLLAKLIAAGESREAARQRALAALRSFPVLGIVTNLPFLIAILEHPRFVAGDVDTHFLDAERRVILDRLTAPAPDGIAAIALAARTATGAAAASAPGAARVDPWAALRGLRV